MRIQPGKKFAGRSSKAKEYLLIPEQAGLQYEGETDLCHVFSAPKSGKLGLLNLPKSQCVVTPDGTLTVADWLHKKTFYPDGTLNLEQVK